MRVRAQLLLSHYHAILLRARRVGVMGDGHRLDVSSACKLPYFVHLSHARRTVDGMGRMETLGAKAASIRIHHVRRPGQALTLQPGAEPIRASSLPSQRLLISRTLLGS